MMNCQPEWHDKGRDETLGAFCSAKLRIGATRRIQAAAANTSSIIPIIHII
jgi:hypothetical protein